MLPVGGGDRERDGVRVLGVARSSDFDLLVVLTNVCKVAYGGNPEPRSSGSPHIIMNASVPVKAAFREIVALSRGITPWQCPDSRSTQSPTRLTQLERRRRLRTYARKNRTHGSLPQIVAGLMTVHRYHAMINQDRVARIQRAVRLAVYRQCFVVNHHVRITAGSKPVVIS